MHLAHISSLHFKWSLLRAGGGGRGATDSGSSWATARQIDSSKIFFRTAMYFVHVMFPVAIVLFTVTTGRPPSPWYAIV
jgi:hypothetical protein